MEQRNATGRSADLAQAQLAAIVECSEDAILSKDLEGIILTWNRAAERLYGYAAEEIIGQSVAILMAPENPDEFISIMERLKRGERIEHHDTVRIHKDGHRIEVSVSISPLAGPDGKLAGASAIARAIGERKRLEADRQAAIERVTRLQRVTGALSEALMPDEVAGVVVEQAVEALGAWAGLAGLVEGDTFRILSAKGYDPGVMQRWQGVPVSGPYPVSEAIRTRQPVWIESHAEYRERYPALAAAVTERTESAAVVPLLVQRRPVGAIVLSFAEARRFEREERELLQALSHQCAQALERARLYDSERRARREAEEARRRSAFLAEASAMLSASLDYEATVADVARAVVPELADWCVVHLLEADGSLSPLAISHADPDKAAWALEAEKRYPPAVRADEGLGLVLRTGKAAVYNGITDAMVARAARDEEHLRILREAGLSSVLMAPLVARGRTLGVLTLVRGRGGDPYTPGDQAMVEDLARRCALAVDNARLFREAQELNRAKDTFQAMLAHELRNPIGAISNALYLLDRENGREGRRNRHLGIASRQLQHVTRLLDDLLDVSRITRGRVLLRMAPLDLGDVVAGEVEALRPAIERRGHALRTILPDAPVPVRGNADRLQQVVRNLLDNAAKYTPEGGTVGLCLEREGGEAVLRVRDNGRGIPKDLLPRIFDLFTQADRALDRPEGGLGIGLTLVKSLVEMHGGTVKAVSEGPGRGSEFVVRLPLLTGEAAPEEDTPPGRDAEEASPGPGGAPVAGRSVLLVEDNADAAETLSELLTLWGYTVRVAPDGGTALSLFREERPDVVLLDIGLPGMDGYEVARRLRGMEAGKKTRLVALSGYSQPEDRARSRAAGIDAHLAKPADPAALRELLAAAARPQAA